MLSKDQADRIADQILQQAKSASHKQPGPGLSSIPLLCRCRELRSLPQSVQMEVIHEARRQVMRSPAYILLVLAWILLIVAPFIFVAAPLRQASLITPLIAASWMIPVLARGLFMRHRVRMIAIQVQTLAPIE